MGLSVQSCPTSRGCPGLLPGLSLLPAYKEDVPGLTLMQVPLPCPLAAAPTRPHLVEVPLLLVQGCGSCVGALHVHHQVLNLILQPVFGLLQ